MQPAEQDLGVPESAPVDPQYPSVLGAMPGALLGQVLGSNPACSTTQSRVFGEISWLRVKCREWRASLGGGLSVRWHGRLPRKSHGGTGVAGKIAEQFDQSHSLGGRSVFGWEPSAELARRKA
jgi:hypothetical protein